MKLGLFYKLAKLKVYILRTTTYLSLINFVLILATFKNVYDIQISNFILIPVGVLFGLFIGILDYVLILKHETEFQNKKNDVKHQITNIENMVREIKQKLK